MNINEALQNINTFQGTDEDTLYESFKVVTESFWEDKLYDVIFFIRKYDLKNKDGNTTKSCKRMYIAWYVKKKFNLTFKHIGILLNRDHSTIVHLVKKHHEMENFNFKFYYEMTKDLRDILTIKNN